jgi:hypothetical protein
MLNIKYERQTNTHNVHKKYMQIRFNTYIKKKVRIWNELHKVMMAKCNSKCYWLGSNYLLGPTLHFFVHV